MLVRDVIRTLVLSLAALLSCSDSLQAQDKAISELSLEELLKSDVVTVNVLGSHVHLADQWMIGFETMTMRMAGNRDGTRRVSTDEILSGFAMAPTGMTTHAQMAMLMYAPTDNVTLIANYPFYSKTTTHVMREGDTGMSESSGFGDLTVSALFAVHSVDEYRHRVLINFGVTVPTGSTAVKGAGHMSDHEQLEYGMQLGSGTFDVMPGVTYLGHSAKWAWGAEFMPTLRTGTNDRGYRLGHAARTTVWGARKLNDAFSVTGRAEMNAIGNIHGFDRELDPLATPMNDPARQASKRLDVAGGLNFYVPGGPFKGHRLAVEAGTPVLQTYTGPQLAVDWQLRVAWQWVFYGGRSR